MSEVDRLQLEIAAFTREIKAGFIAAVAIMKSQSPNNLFKLQSVSTAIGAQFANLISRQFMKAGDNAASAANESLERLDLFFNHSLAADAIQRSQARITAGIMQTTDAAARVALLNDIELVDSIGLSSSQVKAVISYRRLLQAGSLEALQRKLRDHSFDDIIEEASENPLTPDEIDVMVSRYLENQINFRAQIIGETEAVRVVNQANQLFWIQQVNAGQVTNVIQRWVTSEGKVRQSHQSLDKTTAPLGQVFISGSGQLLSFPGDPNAPSSETVNCRCVLVTEAEQ